MGNEDTRAMDTNNPQLTPAIRALDTNGTNIGGSPNTQDEPPNKRIKVEDTSQASDIKPAPLVAAPLPVPVASPAEAVTAIATQDTITAGPPPDAGPSPTLKGESATATTLQGSGKTELSGSSVVTTSSGASNSSSRDSLPDQSSASLRPATVTSAPEAQAPAAVPERSTPPAQDSSPHVPLKATTMAHLETKYLAELEYMLREFRKLERQLLGAKGAAQLEESAGSRERREKLHSFILHLEDTIRQIELGCKLQAEGKSTVTPSNETAEGQSSTVASGSRDDAKKQMAESSALTNLTKEKEEEENVQKLEEHILANLLPVKVRLKKQLAAQQGASRNPAGMPTARRGMLQPPAAARGKGTFAAAAEQRRKQAEAARLAAQQQQEQAVRRVSDPTQFGKPLSGGGSSLTQKLHGATLGSKQRIHGHGVGSSTEEPPTDASPGAERKILYAGMVPGSRQHQSGVAAASGVHELVIEDPNLLQQQQENSAESAAIHPVADTKPIVAQDRHTLASSDTPRQKSKPSTSTQAPPTVPIPVQTKVVKKEKKHVGNLTLTEDEKRRMRKKRRKRKLRRIARRRERERQRQIALQQAQAAQGPSKATGGRKKITVGKGQGKKKGPRVVEYICALCSEAYSSTSDCNPWWALAQHECPKCRKNQVPRIDITSPANIIEYHPALLAHADDNNGGGESAAVNVTVMHIAQPLASSAIYTGKACPSGKDPSMPPIDSDSDSDLSELSDGSLSDGSLDSDDSVADLQSMSPAEHAEHERFGHNYKGPTLSDDHASRLLVLMAHASTCPCKHKLTKHRDVCRSTKYMMLHVRDCPGTTSTFDVCPFPWCRKVKHLLYHLVSCTNPSQCSICSPTMLSSSLQSLIGLNDYRLKKHRERMLAAMKAVNAGRPNVSVLLKTTTLSKTSAQRKAQSAVSRISPVRPPNPVKSAHPAKPAKPQDMASFVSVPSKPTAKAASTLPAESVPHQASAVGQQKATKAVAPCQPPKEPKKAIQPARQAVVVPAMAKPVSTATPTVPLQTVIPHQQTKPPSNLSTSNASLTKAVRVTAPQPVAKSAIQNGVVLPLSTSVTQQVSEATSGQTTATPQTAGTVAAAPKQAKTAAAPAQVSKVETLLASSNIAAAHGGHVSVPIQEQGNSSPPSGVAPPLEAPTSAASTHQQPQAGVKSSLPPASNQQPASVPVVQRPATAQTVVQAVPSLVNVAIAEESKPQERPFAPEAENIIAAATAAAVAVTLKEDREKPPEISDLTDSSKQSPVALSPAATRIESGSPQCVDSQAAATFVATAATSSVSSAPASSTVNIATCTEDATQEKAGSLPALVPALVLQASDASKAPSPNLETVATGSDQDTLANDETFSQEPLAVVAAELSVTVAAGIASPAPEAMVATTAFKAEETNATSATEEVTPSSTALDSANQASDITVPEPMGVATVVNKADISSAVETNPSLPSVQGTAVQGTAVGAIAAPQAMDVDSTEKMVASAGTTNANTGAPQPTSTRSLPPVQGTPVGAVVAPQLMDVDTTETKVAPSATTNAGASQSMEVDTPPVSTVSQTTPVGTSTAEQVEKAAEAVEVGC